MAGARKKKTPKILIDSFDLKPGRILANKYEVVSLLGSGWESEVYLIREMGTGIERAAKVFFPHRNPRDRTFSFHAKKLFKLRHCDILIQYLTQEKFTFRRHKITFLVSDYVEGEPLKDFLKRQPGKRLTVFEGLHLLYAMALGIEPIHYMREYHGDIHDENILVQRYGVGFELRLLDLFQWKHPRAENIHDDVLDMVRVFYDAIGGARHYAKHPPVVKAICCGLKKSLILKKFRTAGQLRQYLENMEWD